MRQTRDQLPPADPCLILIDPLSSGGSVELDQIEALHREPPVPILLIADPADPLPAVLASRAMNRAPWDVVYRDAPIEEYLMRIERLRGQVDRLDELKDLRYRAIHDDRTELLRPGPFQDRLSEHFSAAGRHRLNMAFVIVDLDEFGKINKDFDHTVGDQVIERVGAVIRNSLRAEDVGGRLGGDEFAVVLPYTRKVDAARVVNRMRDEIQTLTGPLEGMRRELHISGSLGFETYDGTDLESVETLRRHAEIALRRAKVLGGNRGLYYRSLTRDEVGESPQQDRA
jgi:diguanylate cyclase (GGDEF)-like protein